MFLYYFLDRLSTITNTETLHRGGVSSNAILTQYRDLCNEGDSNTKSSSVAKSFKQSIDRQEKNWLQILENIYPIVIKINSFYKQVCFLI